MSAHPIDDCWSRIGVHGDGSCPELTRHIHCHNCPVHAAAALALLDREPPDGSTAGWTAHFARALPLRDADMLSLFVFRIGADWLAVPTHVVAEVAPERTIHAVPHRTGGAFLGVVNVHGALRVCLSLAVVLGLDTTATQRDPRFPRGRMVMIRVGEIAAACPVDEVSGIHKLPPGDVVDTPATVAGPLACATRIWSWGARTVGVLDETLLGHSLRRSLA